MGIFDFLRKLVQGRKTEPEKEKVSLSDLGAWAENKINHLKSQEKATLDFIQEKVEFLADELKEKINAAESFDVSLKKVEDRIKSSVEEGRKKYLEAVEDLIESLNNLKKEKLEEAIADTNRIFLDFNKRSRMSYERATILIGKEMGEIKESLKAFSKSLIKIFNEKKGLVESFRTISSIKLKLSQFEKIEQEIKQIDSKIIFLNNEIGEKEKESREILSEIDAIKKTPEYLKKLEKQEKIKLLQSELGKEISDLRQLIDFKALGDFHHIFEDKMQMVKAHIVDFQANFQKDNGNGIIGLLEVAKLNSKNISDKLNQIHKKKEEILKLEAELEAEKNKDKTNELYPASTKAILETGDLKNKKSREEKRLKKLKANKEEIISKLKENLEKLGAELN